MHQVPKESIRYLFKVVRWIIVLLAITYHYMTTCVKFAINLFYWTWCHTVNTRSSTWIKLTLSNLKILVWNFYLKASVQYVHFWPMKIIIPIKFLLSLFWHVLTFTDLNRKNVYFDLMFDSEVFVSFSEVFGNSGFHCVYWCHCTILLRQLVTVYSMLNLFLWYCKNTIAWWNCIL